LGFSFPAVRSLTLLSLADPLLSVASTSWMSAVQRKELVANASFQATRFHDLRSRQAAVHVGRQPTLSCRWRRPNAGGKADIGITAGVKHEATATSEAHVDLDVMVFHDPRRRPAS
jgi:hypothetical protein